MKRFYLVSCLFLLSLLFLGCSTTLPRLPQYFISEEDRVFNFPPAQVWSALVLAIGNIDWSTDFLDQASGSVKFKTSYVYTDQSNRLNRLYQWPQKYQVEYSDISGYLKRHTYAHQKIPGRAIFDKENLIIQLKHLKPETRTRIEMVYSIEVYSSLLGFPRKTIVQSNGQFEAMLLAQVRHLLGLRSRPET